uniref:Uncharacterized protein n=1 Tax=Nelumbo nucifera TaxID=4432 RepID=A0A822YTZ5_NELNU|nr:TPA_asm: hypothetical protein HUJ06_004886 [Nelumbo nucifera]
MYPSFSVMWLFFPLFCMGDGGFLLIEKSLLKLHSDYPLSCLEQMKSIKFAIDLLFTYFWIKHHWFFFYQ